MKVMEGRPPTGRLSVPHCALEEKKVVCLKSWGGGGHGAFGLQMNPQLFLMLKKKDLKQILYYSIYLKYFILKNSEGKVYKDAATLRLGCQRVDST